MIVALYGKSLLSAFSAKLLFNELNKLVNKSLIGAYFIAMNWQKGKQMKEKMVLNDGTIIELEVAASLTGLTTVFTDWRAAATVMPKLTEENLSKVEVQNGEGLNRGNYTDLVLQPGSWEEKADGLYITISLREKTDLEKRMDNMESDQEVQNEAITELAGLVGGA